MSSRNRSPPPHRAYPSESSPRGYDRPSDRSYDRDRNGSRGYERDRRDDRPRSRSPKRERHDDRERVSRDHERTSRGGYRGGDGVGGGGGRGHDYPTAPPGRYDSRRGGDEREERPLDRRAIEEGRRRREEERANGTVYTDEPKGVPTGPRRGVTAQREDGGSDSASPFPEIKRERGDNGEVIDTPDRAENGDVAPEEEVDDAAAMAAMMGFGGFVTTKGKGNGPNADGGVNVHKQRTWRQYMNRRGGFNRPLEKVKQ